MDAYQQLNEAFKELEKNRKGIFYDISDVTTAQQILELKEILETHGIVILTNAVSDQSIRNLHHNISDCAKNMFGLQTSDADIFDSLNKSRNPANGFGNASFSYFFKQPCLKSDTISTKLNGDRVYLTENYGYQVNLNLLADNPHTYSVLIALTHPIGGMVSWDSFKLANNPKPIPKGMTKQTLTKCHFDAYGGGINNDSNDGTQRYQAIISIEDRIKLGYVPDSIHPTIKSLLTNITKNQNLYKQAGFKSFNDDRLLKIFNKYIVAPPSGSLVLWKSGIIHYEAEFRKKDSLSLYTFKSSKDLPNQKRIRCVVGTHKPLNLSQSELMELARLAENGLIPDMYQNINKESKVYPNIMCSKKTQYKVYRTIEPAKKRELNRIIESKDYSKFDNISNLKKHMYGIQLSIEDLEVDGGDKEMILDSMDSTTKRASKTKKSTKTVKVAKSTKRPIRITTASKTDTTKSRIAPRNGKKRKVVTRRTNN